MMPSTRRAARRAFEFVDPDWSDRLAFRKGVAAVAPAAVGARCAYCVDRGAPPVGPARPLLRWGP
jgi:hypothetical protein